MKHTNTFIKGMDKDSSQQKYEQSKYENLTNGRPVTDKGLSTGAIENIKGNVFAYDFPALKSYMIVQAEEGAYATPTVKKTQSLFIEFELPYPTINQTVMYGQVEYFTGVDYIEGVIEMIKSFNTQVGVGEEVQYYRVAGEDRVVIYNKFVHFVDNGHVGDSSFSLATAGVFNDFRDFVVIGSSPLRNSTYLLTTNNHGPTGWGQVWKSTYDSENPLGTQKVDLIYNGDLNFSQEHPIEAIANHENEEVQSIYWTDNFNPPRKLNVVNPQAAALRPDDLQLSSKAQLYPAIVTGEEQTGGVLPSGIFYVTYKLEKFGGGMTTVAPMSNYVPVIADQAPNTGTDTNYEFTNYPLTIIGTDKCLNYSIPKLPEGFDKIYIYVVFEDSPANYIAYLIEEKLLSNQTYYDFTVTSLGDKPKIPITDLFSYDVDFERVKSLTSKDARLLFANVKHAAFDIGFDARAYRFNPAKETYTTIDTSTSDWGVAKDANLINPENDDRTATLGGSHYSYQKNGTKLGGEGPNIKYEFTIKEVILDQSSKAEPSSTQAFVGDNDEHLYAPKKTPMINQPIFTSDEYPISQNDNEVIDVDMGPGFRNFKNTRWEHYYKGYMRDEVYRFGIVFYSKTGRPSEVKWIGDIRMPIDAELRNLFTNGSICKWWSPDDNVPSSGIQDVGSTSTSNSSTEYEESATAVGGSLGIKFTVDVSSIISEISGYSIVRAPRRERDRTILAEGSLGEVRRTDQVLDRQGEHVLYVQSEVHDKIPPNPSYPYVATGVVVEDIITFDAPDLKMITGAKIRNYKDGPSQEEDYYYIKPVAGFVHTDDTDIDSVTAPLTDFGPAPLGMGLESNSKYTKSLLRIFGAGRDSRLKATKIDSSVTKANSYGRVADVVKVESGQLNVPMQNKTFHNKGMLVNVNGTVQLRAPAAFTVLLGGDPGKKMSNRLLLECFGYPNEDDCCHHADYEIGDFLWGSSSSTGAEGKRRGQTAIVDLYRHPKEQYGGNTFVARQNTEYITTGHYAAVNKTDIEITATVFGGDIMVSAFPEKKFYEYVDGETFTNPQVGKIYPVQTIGNMELRVGFHFNNFIQGGGGDIADRRRLPDEYLLPIMYHREKNLQTYLVEGEGSALVGEYDNRVYMSQAKTNGEKSDSWSVFRPLNYLDVDGHYGPINKIDILNEKILFFQDKAHGSIALNPRAVVTDIEGSEIELGTGRGLVDFTYISNSIGAFHQWGVLNAKNSIYFFDAYHKKLYMHGGGKTVAVSDKGSMSSFFFHKIRGSVLQIDNPLLFEGVTAVYDHRFNEAIFTFHSKVGLFIGPAGEPNSLLKQVVQTEYSNRIISIETMHTSATSYALTELPEVKTTTTGSIVEIDASQGQFQLVFPSTQSYIDTTASLQNGDTLQIFDGDATGPERAVTWIDAEIINSNQNNYQIQVSDSSYWKNSFVYTTGFPNNPSDAIIKFRTVGPDADFNSLVTELDGGSTLQIKAQNGLWYDVIPEEFNPNYISFYLGSDLTSTFDPTPFILAQEADPSNIALHPWLASWPAEIRTIKWEYVSEEGTGVLVSDDDTRTAESITIVFNERMGAFSSFYDHFPRLYINDSRRIFSQVPSGYSMYIHDEGQRGEFYGVPFPMNINIIVNPPGDWTKVFNNIEFYTTLEDETGKDIFDETFQQLLITNEHQTTDPITLVVGENIQRRMRTWRLAIPRDKSGTNARIRNPYIQAFLQYRNVNGVDRRFIIYDVNTHYIDQPM